MQKKTIVTLVIILLIAIMFIDFNINHTGVFELFFHRIETDSMYDRNGNFAVIGTDDYYSYNISRELLLKKMDKEILQIDNQMGSVEIIGEDRNNIKIDANITVYTKDELQEEKILNDINIELRKTDKRINLSSPSMKQSNLIKGIKIDYKIKAPQTMFIDIENRYGKLDVSNFHNGVNLSNKYKDSIITDLSGKEIKINVKYGDLRLSNITDLAEVHTAYNKTEIINLSDKLELDSAYSEVEINGVKGKIDCDIKYGEADFYNIVELELDSKYTEININNISGEMNGDLKYGEISVNGIKNNLDLNGQYTTIDVKLASNLNSYELRCETEYGNIYSNLPVTIENNEGLSRVRYKVGNGDLKISLDTEHANIEVNK